VRTRRVACDNEDTEATEFHNYRFVSDLSFLPGNTTINQANHRMQHSFSSSGYISGIPCLWTNDLETEFRQNHHYQRHSPENRGRTCNSFIQYRILAQRCFTGQQTDISKEVEALWRDESKEMYFFCLRNSEIETCSSILPALANSIVLGTTNCAPRIDPRCSAHPQVRALSPLPPNDNNESPSIRTEFFRVGSSNFNYERITAAELSDVELSSEVDAQDGNQQGVPQNPYQLSKTTAPYCEIREKSASPAWSDPLDFSEDEDPVPLFSPNFAVEFEDLMRVYREKVW
jgi:hypothetical protein